MLDLAFWRSLRHRRMDDADLAAHLREMAEWPVLERLPFLGFLPPLFNHPQASIRAAALSCLSGCTGIAAYEHLVAALQDSEESVRLTAVEALRTSLAGNDWARWAHVLFHSKADVRQAGMRLDRIFPPPDWWAVYLLPDPACAEAARAKLRDLTLAVDTVPVLIDYARRGILSRVEARRWTCRLTCQVVFEFFGRWGQRDEPQCDIIAACLEAPDVRERLAEIAGFDPIDDLFELFADAGNEEGSRWLTTLLRDLPNVPAPMRQRILASILVNALRMSEGMALARLAAALDPRVLTCPWLPFEFRREAVNGFYDLGDQTPRHDDRIVMRLLEADVCRRPDGLLDLWAIGAVLHLFNANPYQKLLARFPIAEIAAAFNADPEWSVPFFGLGDRSPQGRKFLIRELCLQARPQRSRLLAILCEVLPADGLDIIEQIEATVAGEIVIELIERDSSPRTPPPPLPEAERGESPVHLALPPFGVGLGRGSSRIVRLRKMNDKKVSRLASLLAAKLAAGQIGPFLNHWMARPQPHEDAFGLAMLSALSRLPETRLLEQAVKAFPVPMLRRFLTAATCCAGFGYDREVALAQMFATHGDEQIRAWAAVRLQPAAKRRELDETAKTVLLRSGYCHQLRTVADPTEPDLETCVSLLASHDLLEEVDGQFARFGSLDPSFVIQLDEEMIANWRGEKRLPLLGHMWLYRWDEHVQAFGARIEQEWPDLATTLTAVDRFASPVLRFRFWEAVSRLIEIWKWHDKPRYVNVWTAALVRQLVSHLTAEVGVIAARCLMHGREGFPLTPWEEFRPAVLTALVAASDEVRNIIAPWIDTRGLQVATPIAEPLPAEEDVRPATEIEMRLHRVFTSDERIAREAALDILDLGESGIDAIADLLCGTLPVKNVRFFADTMAHWPAGSAADLRVKAALDDPRVPAETRYRIGFRLAGQDEIRDLSALLNALNEPGPVGWVDAEDWHSLLHLEEMRGGNETQLAIRLTT